MIGSANLNIMIKAARKAGRSLVKDFREVENLQVSMKGAGISEASWRSAAKASKHVSLLPPLPQILSSCLNSLGTSLGSAR